ncbi:hypothetical protein ITI46_26935 [Streptomyces oryzae]|uniref:Resolvase n=1 Tax=Streptomyces oryzae TaxID=1434886 RepID=A0ABS3XIX8_9ACTN|nr:hypothetical protein [Streptomyces oryzae]MBO8195256.1 hypothetical protein [Streptomyces oryzae]
MPRTHDAHQYEQLREQAVALRREGLSRRQIRDRLKVSNNDLLNRLVQGEPPPAWTRRPNAKDDLRARARELRRQGWTYDRIELELGVSRSSVSLWVRDLPRPPRRTREEAAAIAKRGWERTLALREEERQRTKAAATAEIGTVSDRELFLIGVGLYWAEGAKAKPWRRDEIVVFVNSDPDMIKLFLAWLDLLKVEKERRRYCVMIHESADLEGAQHFWQELTGAAPQNFYKPLLKKHNPKTVRKNTGESYRGCLTVRVRQGAELYRRIEGWWYGIVLGVSSATQEECPK